MALVVSESGVRTVLAPARILTVSLLESYVTSPLGMMSRTRAYSIPSLLGFSPPSNTGLPSIASNFGMSAGLMVCALTLLNADEGLTDLEIAGALWIGLSRVGRVRTRCGGRTGGRAE